MLGLSTNPTPITVGEQIFVPCLWGRLASSFGNVGKQNSTNHDVPESFQAAGSWILWFLKWSNNLPASHKNTPNIRVTIWALPYSKHIWIFKNTNQKSQKSRTSHGTPQPPTPKEREGSSMLTWIHVTRRWVPILMCRVLVILCYHLDILDISLDSKNHALFGCFKTEILCKKNAPNPMANGEVLGPPKKPPGWRLNNHHFPVVFVFGCFGGFSGVPVFLTHNHPLTAVFCTWN